MVSASLSGEAETTSRYSTGYKVPRKRPSLNRRITCIIMLQKFRKRSLMHSSNLVKFVDFSSKTTKRIIFLDFLFIAGATYGFGYMHFSIDFRQKVQKHFPFFLESYYVLNSVVFRNKTLKETDFQTWGIPLAEDDTKT